MVTPIRGFQTVVFVLCLVALSSFATGQGRYKLRGAVLPSSSETVLLTERQFGVRLRGSTQQNFQPSRRYNNPDPKPVVSQALKPVRVVSHPPKTRAATSPKLRSSVVGNLRGIPPRSSAVGAPKTVIQHQSAYKQQPLRSANIRKPHPETDGAEKSADDEQSTSNSGDEQDEDDNGDTDFTLNARLAGSFGFDSNFKEQTPSKGSPFHRYDAGLDFSYDTDGVEVELKSELTLVDLIKEDKINRWRLAIEADAKRDLEAGRSVALGFSHENDELDLNSQSATSKAFLELSKTAPLFGVSVRGALEYERNQPSIDLSGENADDSTAEAVNTDAESDTEADAEEDTEEDTEAEITDGDNIGSEDNADNLIAGRENTVSSTIEATLRLRPQSKLSPFVKAGWTDVYIPEQDKTGGDRNATSQYVIAGLRFKPDQRLTLDLGGRFELRRTGSAETGRIRDSYADIKLEWKPVDDLSVDLELKRYLDVSFSEGATYAQTTEYTLGVDWQLKDKLSLEFSADLEESREKEIDAFSRKLELTAKSSYDLSASMGVFLALQKNWLESSQEDETTEKFQRTQIWAGLEIKL